ncbi:MAG: PilZ domain-containing protein [Betaproteobacteria bacterium]|nr:PilZ domain-containing protein [Betaproteobacteria bacterium]
MSNPDNPFSSMMSGAGTETSTKTQRQFARFQVSWRVSLVFGSGANRVVYRGSSYDISMGGLCFRSENNIPHKEEGSLLLLLPAQHMNEMSQPLEIRSQVVYSAFSKGAFRIGVKFNEFKPGDRAILDARLRHLAAKMS